MERRKQMKKSIIMALTAVLFLAATSIPTIGQERSQKPELKTELVRLKYANPLFIRGLLEPYQSRSGKIYADPAQNILVISDQPENFDRMLGIIKELDVKPVDLEFSVQLLLGSETADSKIDQALENNPIVAELKKLLRYKSFSFLDQTIIRTINIVTADVGALMGRNPGLWLEIREPRYIKDGNSELIQIAVRLLQMNEKVDKSADQGSKPASSTITLIKTNLTMKSGEKTVVGVSKLDGGDKGLILIISGKVIE
jgi:hypothetical protein